MGNGRKMKHAVGTAAKGHIYGQGIFKCLPDHKIPGLHILFDKFQDTPPGLFCKTQPGAVDSRDGSVSGKGHPQHLCQTVHTVGSKHAGTRAAGGTCFLLISTERFPVYAVCLKGTDRLGHGGIADVLFFGNAGEHRPSAHKNGGNVQACGCHEKAGNILVTVRHHDKAVKGMSHGHGFCGICDQLSCHKGILHSLMSHGNSIAHCDRRKYNRNAACLRDTLLNRCNYLIQIHMPRHNLVL